jgi:hypothetical protein
MAKEKEFEVKANHGGKIVYLPIRAATEQIAKELAARLLKRKSTKPATVLGATEKKP